MRAASVGLLIEEQRGDVVAAWRRAVEAELDGEPALGFAVGPLLREMALDLRGEPHLGTADVPVEGGTIRSVVLVRSAASAARVAREFKLLHRALWDTLRAAGRIVSANERRAADEWLDEALAAALDRLDRVRTRIDLLERSPVAAPRQPGENAARPPPLPRSPHQPPPLPRQAQRPPPLPTSAPNRLE